MESLDSSPNYMKATSSSVAKKETCLGRNDFDDTISITSSTCGSSSVNGPNAPKPNNNNGIKYMRTSSKRALKNFGIVRSFRRRAKSRTLQQPALDMSDESLVDISDKSPHYKATSSSKGKKTHSAVAMATSPQHSASSSLDSQGVARTSSNNVRTVRILLKRTSFKPRRTLLNRSRVSEDVSVDRATYSSVLKDSKFPDTAVAFDYDKEKEDGKMSMVKICRYHHCSLHGHCRGDHDSSPPPPAPKRLLYKRRKSLKKQRSIYFGEKKKNSKKSRVLSPDHTDNSNREEMLMYDKSDLNSQTESCEHEIELFEDKDNVRHQDLDFLEIAFGEMSFPERSYQENLSIQNKYSQDFWLTGHCLGCSCNERGKIHLPKRPDNGLCKSNSPEAPVKFDETSQQTVKISLTSDSQASSSNHSEEEREFANECDVTEDSKALKLDDSQPNSTPASGGGSLQFKRDISMWQLIHQHMSANLGSESENKELEGENVQDQVDSSGSCGETTISETNPVNEDLETQEIEVRKLLAIKLVREAIEKILLPEVQDQTSDDQSTVSETFTTPQLEVDKDNQSVAEENGKDGYATNDLKAEAEITVTEKKVWTKSEKKAPKHWSNLKKWILLQRFIKALEKVRKFNPKKPNFLDPSPDPEAEKVNLRPQTLDERKRSEEWMLDYALRQAVNELAPTQKEKVALLVKAFETVVPPQEDTQVQLKISRLISDDLDISKRESNDDNELIHKGNEREKGNVDDPDIGSRSLILDENEETVINNLGPDSRHDATKLGTNTTDEKARDVDPAHLQDLEKDRISSSIEADRKDHNHQSNMEMERKNHLGMWHMLCQHVFTDIADKMGSQLLDGSDDEESQGEESSVMKSGDYSSNSIDNARKDNNISRDLRSGFTKSDALRIVKEAIEDILVQDVSSNTQSVASDSTSSEQEISEQRDHITKDEESNEGEAANAAPEISTKPTTELVSKPKNWNKLKKLMLLKRSIKALEKARKLKPQVSDAEPAEKIGLRREMMDERKKAEKWMLDYAVQHIVGKLTPSRKQRVSMLVEAFEAVVPFPES